MMFMVILQSRDTITACPCLELPNRLSLKAIPHPLLLESVVVIIVLSE